MHLTVSRIAIKMNSVDSAGILQVRNNGESHHNNPVTSNVETMNPSTISHRDLGAIRRVGEECGLRGGRPKAPEHLDGAMWEERTGSRVGTANTSMNRVMNETNMAMTRRIDWAP